MPEQRNRYKGSPPRPWIRFSLVAADGTAQEIEALADTGNPCALIVGEALLKHFNLGLTPGMTTNFGALNGGWLRVRVSALGFEQVVLAYGSDAVLQAVQASHADLTALAGLPLLQSFEYGGDRDDLWLRSL
jgi:hypothetical protein